MEIKGEVKTVVESSQKYYRYGLKLNMISERTSHLEGQMIENFELIFKNRIIKAYPH